MLQNLYRLYMEGAKANYFPISVFGFFGEKITKYNVEDIHCPVCGYYCKGEGGFGCIDKLSLVNMYRTDKL